MVSCPHALASEAGVEILKAGGSAVDAAIAASAVLSVVYPHMTSVGGDAFWLIYDARRRPARGPASLQGRPRADAGGDRRRRSRRLLRRRPGTRDRALLPRARGISRGGGPDAAALRVGRAAQHDVPRGHHLRDPAADAG